MEKAPEHEPRDMRELIYRGVESEELDYKAAMSWTAMSRAARAKIVRHCLALANTKGGYIVIGVGEDASGHPSVYQGLTPEETHSFDPSTVGPFVNRYVEPPIDLTVERPLVDGKRYAVLVVRPFRNLPHVCTASIENELQTGMFYIRTSDASSRPAFRAVEMHALIQRALRNQREALGRMLRGILYESRDSVRQGADLSEFRDAVSHAQLFFKRRKSPPPGVPAVLFNFQVIPPEFDPEHFTLSRIRRAVGDAWTLLASSGFIEPGELEKCYLTNVSLRSLPEGRLKMWQVFKSGLFHYIAYWPVPNDTLPYKQLATGLSEAVCFLGKLYTELGYAEELLTLRITLEGTEEVKLKLSGRDGGVFRCRIPEIAVEIRRTAADLASGCEMHAARLIREVTERFNLPDQYLQNLPREIRRHLEKR